MAVSYLIGKSLKYPEGTELKNVYGDSFVVGEYLGNSKFKVRFNDSKEEVISSAQRLDNLTVEDPSKFHISGVEEGGVYESNNCGKFKVIKIIDKRKAEISFLTTSTVKEVYHSNIRSGTIKDPYYPVVCEVGYIGNISVNKNTTILYRSWNKMLSRCYCKKDNRFSCYGGKGVSVDPYFHNYSNFYLWASKRYSEGFSLDKDLLCWYYGEDKRYSPETCCFIPKEVNTLLSNYEKDSGVWETRYGKFSYGLPKGRLSTKHFSTKEEALKYKHTYFKEYLRDVFEKYGQCLELDVKDALCLFVLGERYGDL